MHSRKPAPPDRLRRLLMAAAAGPVMLAPIAKPAAAQPAARRAAQPAPESSLQGAAPLWGLDGAPVRLQRHLGRPLLLNFWATWCAPCIAEMPSLQALRGARRPGNSAGLEVVAVNAGQSVNQVAAFLERQSLQLPIALDPQKLALRRWQVRVLPTTLLFDAAGNLRARWVGERDWNGDAAWQEIDAALRVQPDRAGVQGANRRGAEGASRFGTQAGIRAGS